MGCTGGDVGSAGLWNSQARTIGRTASKETATTTAATCTYGQSWNIQGNYEHEGDTRNGSQSAIAQQPLAFFPAGAAGSARLGRCWSFA